MLTPKTTWTKEEFWAELDELGEESVRLKFATGSWGDNTRSGLVTLWLKTKDNEQAAAESAKRDASERKQWWVRPPGLIAIAIISNLLTAAVFYLLGRAG
jgi:hypothetical protein